MFKFLLAGPVGFVPFPDPFMLEVASSRISLRIIDILYPLPIRTQFPAFPFIVKWRQCDMGRVRQFETLTITML